MATFIKAARDITVDLLESKADFTTPISPDNGEAIVHATKDKRCPNCDRDGFYCVYSYDVLVFASCPHCQHVIRDVRFYSKYTSLLQDKLAIAYPILFGIDYAANEKERQETRKLAHKSKALRKTLRETRYK